MGKKWTQGRKYNYDLHGENYTVIVLLLVNVIFMDTVILTQTYI